MRTLANFFGCRVCKAAAITIPLALLPVVVYPAGPLATVGLTSLFDSMWSSTELYQDNDDQGVESFRLVGRYHGQSWSVNAAQGKASGWDNRRVIFGFQALLAPDYVVELQAHINDDFSPVYRGLYTGFIQWSPSDKKSSLSLGRLDYLFTGMERSTSSKKIYTIERGLLVNQIMPGEVVGLYGRHGFGDLTVHAGLFSGDIEREFTRFDAGFAAVFGIAYKLPLFYDKGRLHIDYLYNDGNPGNNAFEPYGNTFSIWHEAEKGRFSLGVDLTAARGLGERSDVWGLTLLPSYDLVKDLIFGGDALQLNLRYQLASSRDAYGLMPQSRYEQEVTSAAGDQYQAFYAGLNYYIYGFKLKLMAGAEYANLKESVEAGQAYDGWTYMAGLRFYF